VTSIPTGPPRPHRRIGDGSDTSHLIGGSVETYLKSQGLSSTNTLAQVLAVLGLSRRRGDRGTRKSDCYQR